MGERAKIILNEYSAKSLLMRDTLDLDKFYTADLKLFVEVARKEIERLNTDKEQLTSLVNSCQEEIRKLKSQLQQKDNIIKEVREYIGEPNDNYWCEEARYILEILKGDDKE